MHAFDIFVDGDSTYMQWLEKRICHIATAAIVNITLQDIQCMLFLIKTQVPELVGPYEREGWIGWCDEQQHDGWMDLSWS